MISFLMGAVERHINSLPAEHEVSDITRRLGSVEAGVGIVNTSIEGVNAGLKRVERIMDLLLQHQLEKGV